MVFRVPLLEVSGPSGTNLVPIWGVALLNVKVVSYLDFMMDEATLTFSNKPPYKASPPSGTKFNVRMGWSAAGMVDKGTFARQRIHLSGTPEQGERVAYICRAGIFDEGLNKVDTQHFGQDTGDTTLGDVFRKLFKDTGKSIEVAPEIDGKPIPSGYMLRQNQTAADAATELAQNNRAIWKVAGDKIIVLALDAGQSVTGQNLGGIAIDHGSCYEYDVEIEPRFSYSSVSVPWFDPGTGKLKTATSPSLGGGGDPGGLPHPAASEDEAKAQADAYAAELGREEFTGLFVIPGSPTATAGAFVTTTGFPDPIDGAKLQCETLTDEVDPGKGWTTTVEVKQVPN